MSGIQPTRKQINFAGKLYGLALLASTDLGESDLVPYGGNVRTAMIRGARAALRMYGVTEYELDPESKALEVGMRLRP